MSNLFVFFVVSASCVSCRRSRKKRTFVDINLVEFFKRSSSVNVLIVYIYIDFKIKSVRENLRVGFDVLLWNSLCFVVSEKRNFSYSILSDFFPFLKSSHTQNFFSCLWVSEKTHKNKIHIHHHLTQPPYTLNHGRYCEKK